MINIPLFFEELRNAEIDFISGVPDTLLNDFCLALETDWDKKKHIIAANEGNAIGLAAGYHLSTKTTPLVYMQNSGIGNIINPLVSLVHKSVYHIPMILLIGWRGEPGKYDHPQHTKQGELTPVLMEDMDIPWRKLENNDADAIQTLRWAINKAKELNSPVALFATRGVLEKGEKDHFKDDSDLLSREEAINCVLDTIDDAIFVASTGRATRELYELRNIRKEEHKNDFLNVGAMGHSSSIALGIALGTERNVICLEGDSSAIMHMGALTTAGKTMPSNYLHIVLNNGVHESVGGQESAGYYSDLTNIAKNSGHVTIGKAVETQDEIKLAIRHLMSKEKPGFLEVTIRKGIRKDMPPLKFKHIATKELLMNNLKNVR